MRVCSLSTSLDILLSTFTKLRASTPISGHTKVLSPMKIAMRVSHGLSSRSSFTSHRANLTFSSHECLLMTIPTLVTTELSRRETGLPASPSTRTTTCMRLPTSRTMSSQIKPNAPSTFAPNQRKRKRSLTTMESVRLKMRTVKPTRRLTKSVKRVTKTVRSLTTMRRSPAIRTIHFVLMTKTTTMT